MEMIGIGVIGAGRISVESHIPAVLSSGRAKLRGVWTRTGHRRVVVNRTLGRCLPWVGNYQDILEDSGVDAVLILTPAFLHASMAKAAIKHGKHVLIEKPLATRYSDAISVVECGKRNGRIVAVGFQRRLSPQVQLAHEILASGKMGDVLTATSEMVWSRPDAYYTGERGTYRRDGGGVLINQGIHSVDLLHHFLGPAVQICAYSKRPTRAIEAEDTLVASMVFDGDVPVTLQCTTAAATSSEYRICIAGSERTLTVTPSDVLIEPPLPDIIRSFDHHCESTSINASVKELIRVQLESFIDAIQHDRSPACTAEEAANSVATVLAAYASIRQGRALYIDQFIRSEL